MLDIRDMHRRQKGSGNVYSLMQPYHKFGVSQDPFPRLNSRTMSNLIYINSMQNVKICWSLGGKRYNNMQNVNQKCSD